MILGWEDPLDEVIATHSSILVWRIPWTEKPGGLQSMGLQRVRHDRQLRTITEYYRIPMEHFDCHIWGLFIFWLCQEAWGTLVPRLGIDPVAPALKVWSLSHWTTREIPRDSLSLGKYIRPVNMQNVSEKLPFASFQSAQGLQ